MRAYLITTGTVFGLITAAHIWRAVVERQVMGEPAFLGLTLIAAGLSVWAFALLRHSPRR